jgi:tetraacyldisaccharide 4'-kinase
MKAHLLKKTANNLHKFVDLIWYKKNIFVFLLWPCAIIFKFIAFLRRNYQQKFQQKRFSTPIIVVGNISVGGVGKTPLVIAIAQKLTEKGLKVGIVSRGYKASLQDYPYLVKIQDTADLVGDEPLLLALRSNCPVVIDPNRCRAVDYIIKTSKPDVIISDDGLQHYKMGRIAEIAVIDGSRMFGNGFCLPAGPLREPVSRLDKVDFIIINKSSTNKDISWNLSNACKNFKHIYDMTLEAQSLYSCSTGKITAARQIKSRAIAIAAIGNPDRFFNTIDDLGLKTENKQYPDHYKFTKEDFNDVEYPIIMTEKDFVKCRDFADDRMFFLRVSAILNDKFWDDFMKAIDEFMWRIKKW